MRNTIQPWLSVRNGVQAAGFYKAALGATETYWLEMPDGGLVARLYVGGAEFWISSEGGENNNAESEATGGGTVRMILIEPNPEALFARALKAGATEIFPVGEGHGWKLGRLADPFGLHWEIGHPLEHTARE